MTIHRKTDKLQKQNAEKRTVPPKRPVQRAAVWCEAEGPGKGAITSERRG